MKKLSFRRFDLGWGYHRGGFRVIAEHDPPTPDDVLSPLLNWSDGVARQRAPFEYWYWIRLNDKFLALIRATSQEGGERGIAITCQAVVVSQEDIPWGHDIRALCRILPPAPIEIGAAANWAGDNTIDIEPISVRKFFASFRLQMVAFVAQSLLKSPAFSLPPRGVNMSACQQIEDAMLLYVFRPLERFPVGSEHWHLNFASWSAPESSPEPVMRFNGMPEIVPEAIALAERWVARGESLNDLIVSQLDPIRPEAGSADLVENILMSGVPNAVALARVIPLLGRSAAALRDLETSVQKIATRMTQKNCFEWVRILLDAREEIAGKAIPNSLAWAILSPDKVRLWIARDISSDGVRLPLLLMEQPALLESVLGALGLDERRALLGVLCPKVGDGHGTQMVAWAGSEHAQLLYELLKAEFSDFNWGPPTGFSAHPELCRLLALVVSPQQVVPEIAEVLKRAAKHAIESDFYHAVLLLNYADDIDALLGWMGTRMQRLVGLHPADHLCRLSRAMARLDEEQLLGKLHNRLTSARMRDAHWNTRPLTEKRTLTLLTTLSQPLAGRRTNRWPDMVR